MPDPSAPARQNLPVRLLVAALTGAAAVAGFAPPGISALAVLAPSVLMLLWQRTDTPAQAAMIGFAFGLAHFGTGVSWVYVSLHDIGMMPAPLAAIATLLFCAILALYPAGVGFLRGWLRARWQIGKVALALMLVPALWTLGEWVRGWLFTGFPWLALGYAQADSPLAGFAPLAGVHGVSFATMLAAGLVVTVIGLPERRRRALAIAAFVALYAAGLALRQVAWTTPAGPPVSVALAQGNVPQSLKFEPGRFESTLDTYRRLVAAGSAELTVLPETALPRFLDLVPPDYLASLEQLARERRGNILLGAPRRHVMDKPGASGTSGSSGTSGAATTAGYTNSVVSLGTAPRQAYAKTHLVPFGEFIPPGFGWVLGILRIPLSDFTRGATDQRPMEFGANLRVAVNICYEDAFSAEIARQLPAATLLVNASNVAWFGDSLAPDQHLQISRLRAIETGRYMLRATNTGATAIIDE
ncbi:MAG: apolipoprotein N-acyltransferase, partial [Betaproteobacteria bacterium]|nr:apolipoprotein N-acyltransferase [Betaproteobacteria bacterium]